MSKLGRITGGGAGAGAAAVPAAALLPLVAAAAPWVVFSVVATVVLPVLAVVPEPPVMPEVDGAAVEAGAGAAPAAPVEAWSVAEFVPVPVAVESELVGAAAAEEAVDFPLIAVEAAAWLVLSLVVPVAVPEPATEVSAVPVAAAWPVAAVWLLVAA
jgi:hypothetical protein